MKQILIILCLSVGIVTLGHASNLDEPKEATFEAPSDCVATLTPSNCMSSSPNIIECYSVTTGSSEEYFIYVKSAPYGVGDGYNVSYAKTGKSGLYPAGKTFETKKEAISYWVKSVYGSSCKYVFN